MIVMCQTLSGVLTAGRERWRGVGGYREREDSLLVELQTHHSNLLVDMELLRDERGRQLSLG